MARDAYEAGCIGQGRYPVIIKSLQLIKTRGFDVKEAEQTKPSRRAVQLHIRPGNTKKIYPQGRYAGSPVGRIYSQYASQGQA